MSAAAATTAPALGFVLTQHWRDTPSGTEVGFWLATDAGPRLLRLAQQAAVAFIPEAQRAQAYPAILAVAGYNDSRVQYWEAAKWVAKLRASKTDNHLLLLKTDLDAGHGGMSGRYQALKDVALEYSFLLKVLASAP